MLRRSRLICRVDERYVSLLSKTVCLQRRWSARDAAEDAVKNHDIGEDEERKAAGTGLGGALDSLFTLVSNHEETLRPVYFPPVTSPPFSAGMKNRKSKAVDERRGRGHEMLAASKQSASRLAQQSADKLAEFSASIDPVRFSDSVEAHNKSAQMRAEKLTNSFNKHLSHASPSSEPSVSAAKAKAAEHKSPVHAHYSAVLAGLKGIGPRKTVPEDKARQQPVELESMTTADLRKLLNECATEAEVLEFFQQTLRGGRLTTQLATQILWRSKVKSAEGFDEMLAIAQGNSKFSAWPDEDLEVFEKEVWLRRLTVSQFFGARGSEDDEPMTEDTRQYLKALFSSMFETIWVPLIKEGELSNDAVRTLWFLAGMTETEFDVLGQIVYGWASGFDKFSAPERFTIANAVVQMWVTGVTAQRPRTAEISESFFVNGANVAADAGIEPAQYIVPFKYASIRFVSALHRGRGLTSRETAHVRMIVEIVKVKTVNPDTEFVRRALDVLNWHESELDEKVPAVVDAARVLLEFVSDSGVLLRRISTLREALAWSEMDERVALIAKKIGWEAAQEEGLQTTGEEIVVGPANVLV
ncbi:hypothetical protein BZA70DRAFT_280584 [Myxozyma melibiosi]|uniref:Uncharacterized protein n=1 Tax=Myxozyma melibiosi TaxID=54550 RepID=A0ABR1F3E0_9ASCO